MRSSTVRLLAGFFLSIGLAYLQPAAADSFTAFESGHVRPLAMSPDGTRLFAVNTPDNRLEIFTITAGAISMAFLPFVLASFIGRGARFFLVAGLMSWGGEAMEKKLRQYVDWIGWGLVALVGAAILIVKLT